MKVALYNLEPKICNTALMQVSMFHKLQGDLVEPYNHFKHDTYDKIYAFSLFDFTNKDYVTKDMVQGGTGFNITSKLPSDIEECQLDYSWYPECDTSYIWFSRGCIRYCPFCVISEKEGAIKSVSPKDLNPGGTYITVMDNSFFANPQWREAIAYLVDQGQPVDIEQGFDIRTMDNEKLSQLSRLQAYKGRLKFAWDNPRENFVPMIKKLFEFISPHKLMCYVLIGYWSTPEEDLYRVKALQQLKIDPFVMPYNKHDKYQRHFTRWVNNYAVFNSVSWKDYWNRKAHVKDAKDSLQLQVFQ